MMNLERQQNGKETKTDFEVEGLGGIGSNETILLM